MFPALQKTPTTFFAQETNSQHRRYEYPEDFIADSPIGFYISRLQQTESCPITLYPELH